MSKQLRIGGASGFWGDSVVATPQLLNGNNLDFIETESETNCRSESKNT